MAIKILQLHHHTPGLVGARRDHGQLRDFYTSVLGFSADPVDPGVFHAPGYCLRLGDPAETPVAATLAVADIAAARTELERRGVAYRMVGSGSGPGPLALRVRDPAGTEIELRQFEGPRAQPLSAADAADARQGMAPPSAHFPNAIGRSAPALQGYRKLHGAVMFADMRGFTSISEHLNPAEVVPLLNEYFELLTGIAVGHGGTVFNMAGDGLMIGFGIPRTQPDAARRAFNTAREMLGSFRLLATDWRRRLNVETGLGIGINAGEVIAGHVGSAAYTSYTIVGDTVNVAARLSQRARAGEALFSSEIRRAIDLGPAEAPLVELPALQLRGRAAPVAIFCLPAEDRVDFRPG